MWRWAELDFAGADHRFHCRLHGALAVHGEKPIDLIDLASRAAAEIKGVTGDGALDVDGVELAGLGEAHVVVGVAE